MRFLKTAQHRPAVDGIGGMLSVNTVAPRLKPGVRRQPFAPSSMRFIAFAVTLATCPRILAAQDLSICAQAAVTLHIPGAADFIALDGDQAWVTNDGRVERLSATSKVPTAAVPLREPCGAMVVGFGSLWVAECQEQVVARINLGSLAVEARIRTGLADPTGELSLATGAGSIWVLSDSSGTLARIDPATNQIAATISVAPNSYAAAYGFGAVWVTSTASAGRVQRVDPALNRVVATIPVGPFPRFLAVGAGGVWTLNQGDGTVSRIDPTSDQIAATIPVGASGPGGDIATGAGRVWVRATKVLLSVIDPRSNRVVRRYGPAAGSGAVRASPKYVWVSAHDIQTVWVLPLLK